MGNRLLIRLSFYMLSAVFYGSTEEYKPKATLTAESSIIHQAGGSLTLTCSANKPYGLTYELYRRSSFQGQYIYINRSDGVFSISEGGIYSCRGVVGSNIITSMSEEVIIQETVSKPTVTLNPNWPVVYVGERVTLRCEIQEGGGTKWTYEWRPINRNSPTSSEYRIYSVYESDSGEYKCRATGDHQLTEWSDAYSLTVRYKPGAKLTADKTIVPLGGSITLTCSVDGSDDWKFDWFRNNQQYSVNRLRGNSEPYRVISVSEGGVYSCRGRRGDPVFLTEKSDEISIEKTASRPTVIQQPDWPVYEGETISLRCQIQGGGGTKWIYEWKKERSNRKFPSSREYSINRVSMSDSGYYWCMARGDHQLTGWSDAYRLTVRSDKPRVGLTAESTIVPAGGSITLTCFLDTSTGWMFDWFRRESVSSTAQLIRINEPDGDLSVSEGGVYSCRGRRGNPVFYTETSREVTIYKTVPITPTVTLKPNWTQIFRGEKVTLRCEIQGSEGSQWTYEWSPTIGNSPITNEYRIVADISRNYECRGRGNNFTVTEWGVLRLSVSSKPQPVLSVSPSWLSPGSSVTLSCGGLEHPSAGWRFFWYKAVPHPSSSSYSFELLANTTNGTEQNSYLLNGPTHTAGYVCRAGRGEPEFYTDYSEPKFIWSADSHPAASLSVSPARVQHFIDQSLTLNCSGTNTEWRVRRFTETASPLYIQCSNWGTMTGSSCTINSLWNHSGVYWCESGSGDFSNAINITVQNDYDDSILVSPVHPVTEGDPVTLSCRNEEQKLSNVFFYHNDKLLQNDSREELKISAVSKSNEGFYRCERSGKESPRSWMSIKVSSPVSSSFPVLLIIGAVPGITVIILLVLLWRYRQSKVDDALYASVKPSEATATDEPKEITYSIININKLRKNRRPRKPEEPVIYAEVKPGAAVKPSEATADEPNEITYSIINFNKLQKERRPCEPEEPVVYAEVKPGATENSSPAATDETVYSEIKGGPALVNESAL